MKKNKILVYGHINMNVLDGSSVFLTSLCNVLSKDKDSVIDLVLATPRNRDVILDSIKDIENINIIDPFNDEIYSHLDFYNKGQMTVNDGAELISFCQNNNNYNNIFIRSLDVTKELSHIDPKIISKTFSYITGVTFSDQEITEGTKDLLKDIEQRQGKLLCQTNQMKTHLLKSIDLKSNTILDLKPMIPDITETFAKIFDKKQKYDIFVYTGKFAPEWNTIPMITQFRELIESHSDAKLYIAGDQFKFDMNNPDFRNISKYLLDYTTNLTWFGALNRSESLALIQQSDIGLTWRTKDLEKSLELSTKMLEYCSLGKPPILNKIEMHEEIFGEDYPFYADDDEDFLKVIEKVVNEPRLVEQWAKKVYEIAKDFTFEATFIRLYPHIKQNNLENVSKELELIEKVFRSQELETEGNIIVFPLKKENLVKNIVKTLKFGKIKNYKFLNRVVIVNSDPSKISSEEEEESFFQDTINSILEENGQPKANESIGLQQLANKKEIKTGTHQNKAVVSEEKYIQTRDFANMANEKYKDTMEKYKKTSAFANMANEKYKDTMEKYKKLLKSYRTLQKKHKEMQNK